MNIDHIRKTQAYIREHAAHYDQTRYVGESFCLAAAAIRANGEVPLYVDREAYVLNPSSGHARKLRGYTGYLSEIAGYAHALLGLPEALRPGSGINLFNTGAGWPEPFCTRLQDADGPEAKAQVAIDLLDWVIVTYRQNVTLELTPEEADVLHTILHYVGGPPSGPRGAATSIARKLRAAGTPLRQLTAVDASPIGTSPGIYFGASWAAQEVVPRPEDAEDTSEVQR